MDDNRRPRHTLIEGALKTVEFEIDFSDERWMREREIGRGGMGRVDLVYDRHLQRRLAMKCLLPARPPEDAQHFIREARITGRLEHPNIPPIHELEVGEDGQPFFTMKHVRGHNLAALTYDVSRALYDHARLHELLDIFRRVCDAAAFAHQSGVVHRDLKLDNVMVGSFGQVYLMDWGIAKVFAPKRFNALAPEPLDPVVLSDEPDGIRLGTPQYMSPEQARGENSQLDHRTDVWALGVMLYEILTKRLPFDAIDNFEVFRLILETEPKTPEDAARGYVPVALAKIVLRALHKDPEQRYQSAHDIKAAIDQYLRGTSEFPSKTFDAGEVIVRAGDVGNEAYVVVDGLCSVWAETRSGEVLLNYIRPGDVFGEAAVLAESRRTATVKAEEATTVYVVSKELIDAEMESQKPWIAVTIRTLAERFRQNASRLERFLEPPSDREVMRHALMYASTFGHDAGQGALIAPWRRLAHECMVRFDIHEEQVTEALEPFQQITIRHDSDEIILRDWRTLASDVLRL